jgi:hypothetical protein
MARGLKAIARHHLCLDTGHLDKMGKVIGHLVRRLDGGGRGLTEKNRARLRPLSDSNNAIALLRLPETLMAVAARSQNIRSGAIQAQVAVALEILLMTAIRIGNLVALDLEQNIVCPGRGKAMHIVIEPEEVKNRHPLDFPLLEESADLVERYLREFWPRLASRGRTACSPVKWGVQRPPELFGSRSPTQYISTRVCACTPTSFDTPWRCSTSMRTPAHTKLCGAFSRTNQSMPPPDFISAEKRHRQFDCLTRQFSRCGSKNEPVSSTRAYSSLQEAGRMV